MSSFGLSRLLSSLVVVLLFAAPLVVIPAAPPTSELTPNLTPALLHLKAGEFDPQRDPLPIPDGLMYGVMGDVLIVQFDGIIQPPWRVALEKHGQVLSYLPDNSYIFRSDRQKVDTVRSLPHVRYVGNLEPGLKLDGALPRSGDVITMNVLYFRDLDRYQVAEDIASLGARVLGADPIMLRIEAPGALAERLAFLPSVMWIDEYHPPVLQNGNAGRIVKVRAPTDVGYDWSTTTNLWSYNSTSGKYEGYAGSNYTAAVADTGVDGSHPGFTGKKMAYYGYGASDWTDPDGHGTHTSGTVLGHGDWRASDPGPMGQYAGMAPLAGLVGQNIFSGNPGSYYTLTNDAVKNGAVVTSNSWGSTIGAYSSDDYAYDILVRDSDDNLAGNQSISAVFSAGNTGSNPKTVVSPSSAKNVISVGALDDSSGTSIAGFSARGTTNDGRVKPDVMAPGVSVMSCSRGGTSYVGASGTSMSCPVAAGTVVIVNEYCNRTRGALPSPALVRNLLVNGADSMGGYTYAGIDQGWGRINVGRSLLNSTNRKIWYEDQLFNISTGENKLYGFNTTAAAELKISLAWTDVAGAVLANPALVNNLDLIVTAPDGKVYSGNVFASGFSVTGGNNDTRNNTEVFRLASPPVGRWLLSVRGNNVPQGPQDYSLVIAGPVGPVVHETVDAAVLDLASSSTDPAEGEELTLTGNIANVGSLSLPNISYQFRLLGPGNVSIIPGQSEIPSMSVGGKTGVQARWMAVRGNYTLFLEADPNMTVYEDSEENNSMALPFRVRGYGLALGCDSPSARTDPARTAALGCFVANRGNVQDTVELTVPPGLPAGWDVTLDPPNVTAGAGQNATFRAQVTPPAGAKAYDKLDFQVRGASAGNRTYNASVNLSITVNQLYGLELTAETGELLVRPGEIAKYPMSVTNTGNGPDTVTLTVSGYMPGWKAQLTDSVLILQSGATKNMTLSVTSPADGKAFDSSKYSVLSSSGNNTKHQVNITTRIRQLIEVGLEQESGPSALAPGESALYQLRVRNGGNYDESLEMEAEAPLNWTCDLEYPSIQVGARSSKLDGLALEVPADALAGEYRIPVTAKPAADRNLSASLNITFMVKQRFGLSFSASGETKALLEAGNGTTFVLVLVNTGNGRDTFRLIVESSPSSVWDIFTNVTDLSLGPRESALVLLTVTSPKDAAEGIYSTVVRAESAGELSQSSTVQFKIDLTVPPAPPVPPPPPPPPPPPTPPDNPPVEDNSIVSKIRSNWLPIALLLTVLIAATVVALAARSRRRRDRDPETEASGRVDGAGVPGAGPTVPAEPYTAIAPPAPSQTPPISHFESKPGPSPAPVEAATPPPASIPHAAPAVPMTAPPAPEAPVATLPSPPTSPPAPPAPALAASPPVPSTLLTEAAPPAQPTSMPVPLAQPPAATENAAAPVAPDAPPPAPPAPTAPPAEPQHGALKKTNDDIADILAKLTELAK